ncbi:hypothetical protein CQW23_22972 [Capsicum baccatum]|uniref:AAA+ ATPase domain-containing protein n=1 Tax=Capsicum baccatum TaxID=33114 RepID=A0A2G2W2I3_CAPBA|nr:hypothetical protein CQW23_22972 [Capsicum baccatum]
MLGLPISSKLPPVYRPSCLRYSWKSALSRRNAFVFFERGHRLAAERNETFQAYKDDAKDKATEGDSRVKILIKDIQELAGDVEDLLDEFLPKIHQSNKCKGAICCCLKTACIPSHASFANEFAMEIEKIKKRVVDIDRVRTTYNIVDTSNNNNDCIPLDRRRLFLYADETEVIGLDDDFNMLQAKLLDQDLPYGVVSIVGMPGLGKTTLAKKLYRHVRDQFVCSGLVYVSQQPRGREILLDIAKQVGVTEEASQDNLEDNLKSLLKTKRYVILLDDIWDVEMWDYLKLYLPECDSKIGSRIILTSRNSNIGRYVGGDTSLHVLQPLDSKNCFELFTTKIFHFDNNDWASASPNLVNIGRDIVGRCGGIPLAIVVTAGMLRARERTEHAWKRVIESMGHKIHDEFAKVLALSYNDLPIASRPCFLYFGLYPEDHEIGAFDLKNMWFAEKFIAVNSGNRREAEDLAEDVLYDLVSRNLIQIAKRTYDGRISSFRIHDLLHSLLRRITFYSDNVMNDFFRSNPKPKKLRALFCFTKLPGIFSVVARLEFKLLHVLVVVTSHNSSQRFIISNKIGNMSCLRYLSPFCRNNKSTLPKDLQTLMWLPDRFFQPILLYRLTNLRKLGIQEVSDSTTKILSISSPGPIMLPNTMEVLKLDFSIRAKEQINLSCYQNVVKLHLRHLRMMSNNSVAFPPNLVKLTMYGCGYNEGKMDHSSDVNGDGFPQLEVLHFVEPYPLSEVTCTNDEQGTT